MPKVSCIVLVDVGGRLEQEVEKERAIILLNREKLEETVLCLPREFWVGQTVQELDEHLLCVGSLRFGVHVAELLEGTDVGFDQLEGLGCDLLDFVFQALGHQL